jgi:hypothetical protein
MYVCTYYYVLVAWIAGTHWCDPTISWAVNFPAESDGVAQNRTNQVGTVALD